MLESVIAFAPSTDLARSRGFYEGVLGLAVVEDSPFAVAFPGLRVTKVDELTPQPFTVVGWGVADIAATVETLTARGVVFTRYDGMGQDASGVWTSPSGARIAWFKDPDGNTFAVTQR
jgi:catechol 2,3-dioxygenase-like lactoylglutathione lyase family enzyme